MQAERDKPKNVVRNLATDTSVAVKIGENDVLPFCQRSRFSMNSFCEESTACPLSTALWEKRRRVKGKIVAAALSLVSEEGTDSVARTKGVVNCSVDCNVNAFDGGVNAFDGAVNAF